MNNVKQRSHLKPILLQPSLPVMDVCRANESCLTATQEGGICALGISEVLMYVTRNAKHLSKSAGHAQNAASANRQYPQ